MPFDILLQETEKFFQTQDTWTTNVADNQRLVQ